MIAGDVRRGPGESLGPASELPGPFTIRKLAGSSALFPRYAWPNMSDGTEKGLMSDPV
jgi:hypothetical protein